MLKQLALYYATIGFRVFPLVPGGKTPLIPKRDGGRGFHDATCFAEKIEEWWSKEPLANVGIATGASRLLVVDLDVPKDGRTVGRAKAELGKLIDLRTTSVLTPSGGIHYYYWVPQGKELPPSSTKKIASSVDVRCEGGYVVAAGSTTPEGKYVPGPFKSPMAPASDDLLGLCMKPSEPEPIEREAPVIVPVGNRRNRYIEAAVTGEYKRVSEAPEGQRNHQLNASAYTFGQLVAGNLLSEDMAWDLLTEAGQIAGLNGWEIKRTIDSGMRAGMQQPRVFTEED